MEYIVVFKSPAKSEDSLVEAPCLKSLLKGFRPDRGASLHVYNHRGRGERGYSVGSFVGTGDAWKSVG